MTWLSWLWHRGGRGEPTEVEVRAQKVIAETRSYLEEQAERAERTLREGQHG